MATQVQSRRLTPRSPYVGGLPDGAWWPQSRRLSEELADLFALWPPGAGRTSPPLRSPQDWDGHSWQQMSSSASSTHAVATSATLRHPSLRRVPEMARMRR